MSDTRDPSPYEIILESIADGVFTVDENWRITSFNRAAEQITGVMREQAIGKKCYDVFRADVCLTACPVRDVQRSGARRVSREVTIMRADGESIPISISAAALRDDAGRVAGGVETFRDLSDLVRLRNEVENRTHSGEIVSASLRMRRMMDTLPDIAASDSTVLIEGPSGSGKELFARAIHAQSPRNRARLVAINCGALPDNLLESELFGYKKGAFTDARRDKPGRIALAERGTLFLDEISELSPLLQVKLLRFIQERTYEALGDNAPRKADVRIIAAGNRNLESLVREGRFRSDLYYRLNVVRLLLPALRERPEDIPLLTEHFLRRFNARTGKNVTRVDGAVMSRLLAHDYPGNVRELENIIEHAYVLLRGDTLELQHLPPALQHLPQTDDAKAAERSQFDQAEVRAIRHALKRHNGNKRATARELGIHPSTLWRKMKRLGIR